MHQSSCPWRAWSLCPGPTRKVPSSEDYHEGNIPGSDHVLLILLLHSARPGAWANGGNPGLLALLPDTPPLGGWGGPLCSCSCHQWSVQRKLNKTELMLLSSFLIRGSP
uniref:Uncharacterized protein n=1 Tax=Eutreptiella gymnastica TaxID=73025 RepID=A0A7S4LBI2_9EUGL